MSTPSVHRLPTKSYQATQGVDVQASTLASAYEDIAQVIHGRYRIDALIGEGGMGVVYRAYDLQVDRQVAIKLIRRDCLSDQKFLIRFRRELEITSQFRHPSTIRVYEHGETQYDGRPYMVMELLTGQSLADLLTTKQRLSELDALEYARQIAESLSEAHEHEIFHRDLKPENIFIETVGVSTIIKVLDFGIAGSFDGSRLTQAGEVFGTPEYMSPEQCNGHPLDHRTDIYSLGCILYEMIEGQAPFLADTPMATMLRHVRSKLTPPRHCHPQTAKLLQMALRKDRGKRIQSAGQFAKLICETMEEVRASQKSLLLPEESSTLNSQLTSHTQFPSSSLTQATTVLPSVSSTDAKSLPASYPPNSGRFFVLTLAAAAAILVGIFVFSQSTVSESEEPETGPHTASSKVEPAAHEPQQSSAGALPNTRPLVTSNVEGASVFVDSELQCKTPCEVEIPVGDDRNHEIRLSHEGYMDVVYNWRPASVTDVLPPLPPMLPVQEEITVDNRRP